MTTVDRDPAAGAEPFVSVVVLSYNSERHLTGCLASLARSRGVRLEVIVVDNASQDRSAEIAARHTVLSRFIQTGANLGYSGGNNVGWRAATAPIVVFLNPDCWPEPDAIRLMVDELERDATVGIVGARLLYPHTDLIQHAGGVLYPNGMCEHLGLMKKDGPEWRTIRDVDYVTGALIAIRRGDVEALGGFDEEYHPAYYEESDWCVRLARAGRRVRYAGAAAAYHAESPGLTKLSWRFQRTNHRSRWRFVIKNHGLWHIATRALPFEWRWMRAAHSRGYRRAVLLTWPGAVLFALRCLLRFSRRRRAARG
ncbi:MAG: glycosyltransferase family 2 protein [Candidatus Sumerlaeia bacterium]|nr:glycosyltransferase family 2 protein [Candidatus Sumerlaeia bacterium]